MEEPVTKSVDRSIFSRFIEQQLVAVTLRSNNVSVQMWIFANGAID